MQSTLKSGRIPLWNPYVLCGQPYIGNPQSWVFYPTTVLLFFTSASKALAVNNFIHVVIAGLGYYKLLRHITANRLGALVGGLLFAGSGFVVARFQFPTMVMAYAWVPWLLFTALRVTDKPTFWVTAQFSGICALEILAGHSQVGYMAFGITTLYVANRIFIIKGHIYRKKAAVLLLIGGFILGCGISFVQLLPTLQLIGLSTREKLTWWQANRFIVHIDDLLNFILPYHAGNPAAGNFAGDGNFWEPCVYIGLLPLALSIYAIVRGWHRRLTKWWTFVGVISLILAMGKLTPLFWIAFTFIPGISAFHDPARFTLISTLAITVLTSIAFKLLQDRNVSMKWLLGIAAFCVADISLFVITVTPTVDTASLNYRPRIMASAPNEGEARVFTIHRETVWNRYLNYTDYGPKSGKYVHELTDTLAPNIGMRYGVEEASGYEPVPLRAVTEVDSLVRKAYERHSPHLATLIGLFNADTLLLPQNSRYRHSGFTPDVARGLATLSVDNSFPRAWLVSSTLRVDGNLRTLNAIDDDSFDPRILAIVSGRDVESIPFALTEKFGQPKLAYNRSGETKFTLPRLSTSAFLVWSSSCYPGWIAEVDGSTTPIYRTNRAFSGVVVPPNSKSISFSFEPMAYRVGAFVTLSSLSILTTMLTAGFVKRRN
ncbi:MAG: hypothetical protein ABJA67_18750 [Chthonomonadales bacterium]